MFGDTRAYTCIDLYICIYTLVCMFLILLLLHVHRHVYIFVFVYLNVYF